MERSVKETDNGADPWTGVPVNAAVSGVCPVGQDNSDERPETNVSRADIFPICRPITWVSPQ